MPEQITWFRLIEVLLPPSTPLVTLPGQTGLGKTGSTLMSELDQTTNLIILACVTPDSVSYSIVCTTRPPSLLTVEQVPTIHGSAHEHKKAGYEISQSHPAAHTYTIFG